MAKIISKSSVLQIRGKWYMLSSPLTVQIFKTEYELKAGYVCDGPSIPEFIPPAIVGRDEIFYPSIVHDACCALAIEPRIVSDAIFWELCQQSCSKMTATMCYVGVRIGEFLKYESKMPDNVWREAVKMNDQAYSSKQLHDNPVKYVTTKPINI